MRAFAILIAAGVCGVLGIIQVASMAIYGDLAHAPAVPALLPPSWGLAVARRLGGPHAPAELRTAYAQALVHRGDTAAAQPIVGRLPDGIAAADLRGQLAQARNDPDAAIADYARAGDYERAQRLIDDRVTSGALAEAARFEHELAAALSGRGQGTVRARALWRVGQITQAQAAAAADAAQGALLERASLEAYEQALTIAPNEETYLLAAAQQALTLGDKERARRYYTRALDAVPGSADARAGLQRARS